MSHLRDYLVEHPALVWLLGFQLIADPSASCGFDVEATVPSRKQLGRVLRDLDNTMLQFLLSSTVTLIGQEIPPEVPFGRAIANQNTLIYVLINLRTLHRLRRLSS